MLTQHAENHLDKIQFPVNQGKEYIIQRGKYTKMAYGRLQQNWQNAEDAVQDTYLWILEHPPRAMSQKSFEAYFTVVLFSVIRAMFRTERRREKHSVTHEGKYAQYLEIDDEFDEHRIEVVALSDEDENPETAALAKELLGSIEERIGMLKMNHRQIVALNVLYGYKPREIQLLTGDSPQQIWKVVQRFRDSMRGETDG